MTSLSDPSRKYFEACNHTELYQLCRKAGLDVDPSSPREKLVDYLLEESHPPPHEHPIDSLRNGLIGLIQDHWVMIEPQLTCPAKELGPRLPDEAAQALAEESFRNTATLKACYRCEDTKVISCLVENEQHEDLIQLRRKTNVQREDTNMTSAMGVVTPQTAPRDPAELAKLPRFMLKRLADGINLFQNDEQRVGFIDASTEVQAATIAAALKQIDAGGGAPVASPQPVQTPAGAAAQQPAPTPQPEASKPPRTPRNGKAEGGGEDSSALAQALLGVVKGLGEGQEGLKKQLIQMEQLSGNRFTGLEKALADLGSVTKICLGAVIVLAENSLSMPAADLMREAQEAVQRLEGPKGKG